MRRFLTFTANKRGAIGTPERHVVELEIQPMDGGLGPHDLAQKYGLYRHYDHVRMVRVWDFMPTARQDAAWVIQTVGKQRGWFDKTGS